MRTAAFTAALWFVSLTAHADNKAWTAAKAGLPAEIKLVIGLDLAAVHKTQLFATYFPMLVEKVDGQKALEAVKANCKIDPLAVVHNLVLAVDKEESGALYLSLSGIDKATLSSCLEATARAGAKPTKLAVRQDGNVTVVSDGKTDRFLGWVGKDVVVIALHSDDRASLVRWMGGRGALGKSELGRWLVKVDTAAALWGAGEADKEVQPGMTVKLGYGTVAFANGNVHADVHSVMESADKAKAMAGATAKQLDEARQAPLVPATITTVLKAVNVAAANDEVVVRASMPEKDLLGALAIAVSNL